MLVSSFNYGSRNQSFTGQKPLNYYAQFTAEELNKIIESLKTGTDQISKKRLALAEEALKQKTQPKK